MPKTYKKSKTEKTRFYLECLEGKTGVFPLDWERRPCSSKSASGRVRPLNQPRAPKSTSNLAHLRALHKRTASMYMSEDEAKTKWCPMVRTGLTAGMAVNRHISGDVNDETRCLASGCMMWRQRSGDRFFPPRGKCGLAGQ